MVSGGGVVVGMPYTPGSSGIALTGSTATEERGRSIEVNLPNRVSILLGGLQVERLSTYVCTL